MNFVFLTHHALANVLLENGGGPDLGDPVQAMVHSEIGLRAIEVAYRRKPATSPVIQNLISARDTEARMLIVSGRPEEGLKLHKSTVDWAKSVSSKMTAERYQLLLSQITSTD